MNYFNNVGTRILCCVLSAVYNNNIMGATIIIWYIAAEYYIPTDKRQIVIGRYY